MKPPPRFSYDCAWGAVSRHTPSICFVLALGAALAGCGDPRSGDLERVLEAYGAMADRVAWPGFSPLDVPLMLHDVSRTYLIRHPSPPEPFRRVRGFREAYAADTVPADLRANTEARIAGVGTAAVMAPAETWDAGRLAALLLHEAFHVHQTAAHPEWTANEVDLFTYPIRSLPLLRARRLETAALRRALAAPDSLREVCWTLVFLRQRRDRFARLPAEAVGYERGSELREGLARYIEAVGSGGEVRLPGDGFPPEDVRERAYATGHAQARLLDRLGGDWKRELAGADDPALEGLLEAAVGDRSARRCGLSPDEVARSRAVARADLQHLAERDRRALSSFEEAPGWRVTVVASGSPMWPERFDPLNVRVLADRQVLHERWLVLGNESLRLEVLDRRALTRGTGPHPLFDGIEGVAVTGLAEPDVTVRGDTARLAAEGVTLRAVGAEVVREDRTVRVVLPGSP